MALGRASRCPKLVRRGSLKYLVLGNPEGMASGVMAGTAGSQISLLMGREMMMMMLAVEDAELELELSERGDLWVTPCGRLWIGMGRSS